MESTARTTLPDHPPNDVTCGIDWARDDHAVSIVDHRGREIMRSTVEHNAAGLRELLVVLERAGVREVAIERPDGPVVDTLLDAGVTVVVISPNQLKNLRGRYGSAGNKDDRFDALCSPTPCVPTVPGWPRCCPTARPPSPCARPAAPAKTSSPTGLPWPTSCART